MDKEYKSFDFEIKQIDEDKDFFFFEGLATTYGNIDRDDDRIMAGAFADSLLSLKPVVKWKHREPIGISIENNDTSEGLFVKAKTPLSDTFVKGRVKPQVTIGSVRKLSIGFSASEYNWEKVEGRRWDVRNITKGILYEYSLVDIPANNEANVTNFKNAGSQIVLFKQLIDKALSQSGISQEDQGKVFKAANDHISTMGEGKIFKFDDVKDISNRSSFNHFLKRQGYYTKSAREFLAKLVPGRSNSDSAEIGEALKNLTKEFQSLTN